MVGNRSIVKTKKIWIKRNSYIMIQIQLNKNLGICDIILPEGEEFDQEQMKSIRSYVLNVVQGQPYKFAEKQIINWIKILMR